MRLAFEIVGLLFTASLAGYGLAIWQEKRMEKKAQKMRRSVLAGCGCFWCKS